MMAGDVIISHLPDLGLRTPTTTANNIQLQWSRQMSRQFNGDKLSFGAPCCPHNLPTKVIVCLIYCFISLKCVWSRRHTDLSVTGGQLVPLACPTPKRINLFSVIIGWGQAKATFCLRLHQMAASWPDARVLEAWPGQSSQANSFLFSNETQLITSCAHNSNLLCGFNTTSSQYQ